MRRRIGARGAAWVLVILGVAAGCRTALPRPEVRRVSVTDTGRAVSGMQPSASADGRFVVFQGAPREVQPERDQAGPILVKDRKTGTLTAVSDRADGRFVPGNHSSPTISADGRIIAFTSSAALVDGDTNSAFCIGSMDNGATCHDIYVRDRTTGITTRASVGVDNVQANGVCEYARLSGDGRFVVFQSRATNLSADRVDGKEPNIFLRDRAHHTTTLVSVSRPGGTPLGGRNASISDDGNVITFIADALYVRDVKTGRQRRVTLGDVLSLIPLPSQFFKDAILSGNGRTIVVSVGTELAPPPDRLNRPFTRARYDLVLYTIATGHAQRIDVLETIEMGDKPEYPSHLSGFSHIAVSGTARVLAYCRNAFIEDGRAEVPAPGQRREFRLFDTLTGISLSSSTDAGANRNPAVPPPDCLGYALSRNGAVLFFAGPGDLLDEDRRYKTDIFALDGALLRRR